MTGFSRKLLFIAKLYAWLREVGKEKKKKEEAFTVVLAIIY